MENKYVIGFLERNNFIEDKTNVYKNEHCTVTLFESFYQITYWDEDFMEDMSMYTENLSITSLAGKLSYYDFIKRGYEK